LKRGRLSPCSGGARGWHDGRGPGLASRRSGQRAARASVCVVRVTPPPRLLYRPLLFPCAGDPLGRGRAKGRRSAGVAAALIRSAPAPGNSPSPSRRVLQFWSGTAILLRARMFLCGRARALTLSRLPPSAAPFPLPLFPAFSQTRTQRITLSLFVLLNTWPSLSTTFELKTVPRASLLSCSQNGGRVVGGRVSPAAAAAGLAR
jgi:hypothetical protein